MTSTQKTGSPRIGVIFSIAFITGLFVWQGCHAPKQGVSKDESAGNAGLALDDSYAFQIRDLVIVRFDNQAGEAAAPQQERVKENGEITLPLFGQMSVVGKTARQVNEEIKKNFLHANQINGSLITSPSIKMSGVFSKFPFLAGLLLLVMHCGACKHESIIVCPAPPVVNIQFYRVGDIVTVTFLVEPTPPLQELVKEDGTITLPLLGNVAVDGKTPIEVQNLINHDLVHHIAAGHRPALRHFGVYLAHITHIRIAEAVPSIVGSFVE